MSFLRINSADRAKASLQGSISALALSITLYDNAADDDYTKFPSGAGTVFVMTIENEQILCYQRSAQIVTVYDEDTHGLGFLSAGEDGRGYAGTTAASHDADTIASLNVISKMISLIQDAVTQNETDIANRYTKAEISSLFDARNWKTPNVRVATTGNITLSGTQTIDDISLSADDDALVKSQTIATQNGIYTVKSGAWVRRSDFNEDAEIVAAVVGVAEGTENENTIWFCQNNESDEIGTDDIIFSQIGGAGGVDSIFIPCTDFTWQDTNVSQPQRGGTDVPTIFFTDNQDASAYFSFEIPTGKTGIASVELLIQTTATPTDSLYMRFTSSRTRYDNSTAFQEDTTDTFSTYTPGGTNAWYKLALPAGSYDGLSIQAGDIIGFRVRRDASNAADTWNQDLRVMGAIVTFN